MDVLDSVRELGPKNAGDAVDINKARLALQQEISGSVAKKKKRAWSLGLGFGIPALAGATAIAVAIAVGVSVVAPVVPEQASASELLEKAAKQVESAAVTDPNAFAGDAALTPTAGQWLKITEVTSRLQTYGPDIDAILLSPGSSLREGATSAALMDYGTTVYIPGADTDSVYWTETPEHASEKFGDEAAFDASWAAQYNRGTDPDDYTAQTWDYGTRQHMTDNDYWVPLVSPDFTGTGADFADAPEDPQAFLDWWAEWVMAKAPHFPQYTGLSASAATFFDLSQSGELYTAPADYRAKILRALAVMPNVTVQSQTDEAVTFAYADDRFTGTLTLDATTGRMIEATGSPTYATLSDGTQMPTGANAIFPDGVPGYRVTVSFEIVDTPPADAVVWGEN